MGLTPWEQFVAENPGTVAASAMLHGLVIMVSPDEPLWMPDQWARGGVSVPDPYAYDIDTVDWKLRMDFDLIVPKTRTDVMLEPRHIGWEVGFS